MAANDLNDDLTSSDGRNEDLAGHLWQAATRLRANKPSIEERYRWLEAMINHVPDYIYAKDLEGRFLFANAAVVQNNGLERLEDLVGLKDSDLFGDAASSTIEVIEQRVMQSGEPDLGFEERALKGGLDRWLMMSRVPLRDDDGETIGVVGASRDISARKRSELLMSIQAKLLEMIVASTPIHEFMERLTILLGESATGVEAAMFLADGDLRFKVIAPVSLPDLHGSFVEESDIAALVARLEVLAQNRFDRAACRCADIRSSEGTLQGFMAVAFHLNPAPEFCEFVRGTQRIAGIAIDRIRAESRIRFLAERDTLTSLPRRSRLDEELTLLLAEAAEQSQRVAVAFIDVDNFKHVNDSLGHEAGDRLLQEISARISSSIGDAGVVARIGGDEFAVALRQGADDFADVFDMLRNNVTRDICLSGLKLQATVSIGIAIFPDHGTTGAQLLAHADMAMYRAKLNGRDETVQFSPDLANEASQKLIRREELRRAIERDELVLHYQPQKDLQTGQITGVEALVRWQHPRDGLISPVNFIPLAEETGLILELGRKVLQMACWQARAWENAGLPAMKIAVNMSARQFQQADLARTVAQTLEDSGLTPETLEIEITESLIMKDLDSAVNRMKELTDLGVSLALDDFGTGYSSFSKLKQFPFTRLKIDRSFVSDLATTDGMAIVSTIITLAKTLKLAVVAEGVETDAQMEFLKAAGCTEVQGYRIGHPLPAEAMTAFLRAQDRC